MRGVTLHDTIFSWQRVQVCQPLYSWFEYSFIRHIPWAISSSLCNWQFGFKNNTPLWDASQSWCWYFLIFLDVYILNCLRGQCSDLFYFLPIFTSRWSLLVSCLYDLQFQNLCLSLDFFELQAHQRLCLPEISTLMPALVWVPKKHPKIKHYC